MRRWTTPRIGWKRLASRLMVAAALLAPAGAAFAYETEGTEGEGDKPYTWEATASTGTNGEVVYYQCAYKCTRDTCCRYIYVHSD